MPLVMDSVVHTMPGRRRREEREAIQRMRKLNAKMFLPLAAVALAAGVAVPQFGVGAEEAFEQELGVPTS